MSNAQQPHPTQHPTQPAGSERPEARVCCLDLDTFFVSVERIHNPELIGKPVVVGAAPGNRGVVTAASYEVREFGVRSGMSMRDAVRLAPDAVYVPTRHGAYTPYSKAVREILERFSPVVRPASIDEFYVDFSGCERLYRDEQDRDGDATIARLVSHIRATIRAELDLPASAGIGTSHAIAKIASGRAKPEGTLLVPYGGERAFLAPLPVRKFPGIGPVAEEKLHAQGIRTLGQLIAAVERFGLRRYGRLAHGLERALSPRAAPRWKAERPAFREHDAEVQTSGEDGGRALGSISNERTFHHDVERPQQLRDQLRALAERVTWRARKRRVRARTVTLKLRYADFQTITRSKTVAPTDAEDVLLATTLQLFAQNYVVGRPVRLLGVQLSNLSAAARQLELCFESSTPGARPKIGQAVDSVRSQFGYDAIRLGTAVAASGGSEWKA